MKKFLVHFVFTVNGRDVINYTSTTRAANAADAIEALSNAPNIPEPPKDADSIELTLSITPS